MIVVVTLNPYSAQTGTTSLDMPALGLDWNDRFAVHDEMGAAPRLRVGPVQLRPSSTRTVEPAHVFVVRR